MAARNILITGASSGIGLSAALQLAAAHERVIAAVRNSDRAAPVVEAAAARGVEIATVVMDVGDDASVDRGMREARERHGPIDVLVANAGVGAGGSAEQLSIADFREAMEINFYGVLRVTKAALPEMRARRSGRLIAVSSVAGAFGQPFNDAYCAAKCAVEGLYESLRPVVAQFGVHVSIVEPGPVASEFSDKRIGLSPASPPAADDPYAEMWRRYVDFMAAGDSRQQSVADAARAIVDVCNAREPLLRYQTSRFTSRLVGMKLADLNGSVLSDFTSTWIAAPAA